MAAVFCTSQQLHNEIRKSVAPGIRTPRATKIELAPTRVRNLRCFQCIFIDDVGERDKHHAQFIAGWHRANWIDVRRLNAPTPRKQSDMQRQRPQIAANGWRSALRLYAAFVWIHK